MEAAVDPRPQRCGFTDSTTRHSFTLLSKGIAADRQRPVLPDFLEDADAHFRVHYTRTGTDAVPLTDLNFNTTPDYVEEALAALLFAYRVFRDTMQYTPLPSDDLLGGSSALDVYLHDLSKAGASGTGLYGSTQPETRISTTPPFRYTSWIEIDNDFSPDDKNNFGQQVFATHGIDALRVTCSHELHHSVQLGGYGDTSIQLMVYEMCSVWMEMRTWPTIYDWMTYTNQLLIEPMLWPFSDPSSTNGYAWGWYGNAMAQHHGDAGMRRVWENIKNGDKPFEALVKATSGGSYDFATQFCRDISTLYYTGSRGDENTILPRSDSLPEIYLSVDIPAQTPSEVITGDVRPFEVRVLRFSIPPFTTTDPPYSFVLVMTWPETEALIASESGVRMPYSVTLTTTASPTVVPIPGTPWFFDVEPNDMCYTVQGVSTARTESPYPQPLVLSTTQTVYIPIADAIPGDVVDVSLMTVQTLGISRGPSTVILDDTRIVVPYTVPSDLVNGTYLVDVLVKEKHTLVKIVVK